MAVRGGRGGITTGPEGARGGASGRSPYVRGRSGGMFSWAWVVLGVLCGFGLAALGIRDGHPVDIVIGLSIAAVCILMSRPSRQAIARKAVALSGRPKPDASAPVVVYWRADDMHSLRLRSALRDVRDDVVWINLFYDLEAELTVRRHNNGDEVLPLVMINGTPHIDPVPDLVRLAVQDQSAES